MVSHVPKSPPAKRQRTGREVTDISLPSSARIRPLEARFSKKAADFVTQSIKDILFYHLDPTSPTEVNPAVNIERILICNTVDPELTYEIVRKVAYKLIINNHKFPIFPDLGMRLLLVAKENNLPNAQDLITHYQALGYEFDPPSWF